MTAIPAESLVSLKNRLQVCRDIGADPASKDFKAFFKWVFEFNCDYPATMLDIEVACALLPMLVFS
jgi:DCN1-like protein 4/5